MHYYNAKFNSDGLLDTNVREVPSFKKKQKHLARTFFSNYVFLKDMYQNSKESGIIQAVSKLTVFVNL